MTRTKISFAVCIVVLMGMMIPAVRFVGVEDFDRLLGYETMPPKPAFSVAGLKDGSLRYALEQWYSKNYFTRNVLTKVRYQVYEWLNVGMFHNAGTPRMIASLADGALISKDYVMCHLSRHNATALRPLISELAETVRMLRDVGVEVVFVQAPDKSQLHPSPVPWYVSLLWRWQDEEPQVPYYALLREYGIPALDACAYLRSRSADYEEPMFPYAGVHWNALAASLTAEKILQMVNSAVPPGCKLRINRFVGVSRTETPAFGDDDIGSLTNLPINPFLKKNIRYVPCFENKAFEPNPGKVILFGDSFMGGVLNAFIRARCFRSDAILACDKRFVSKEELSYVLPELRLLLFVYQPPHMTVLDGKFGAKIRDFCGSLRAYYDVPKFKTEKFSSLGESIRGMRGFASPESWGVWSTSQTCSFLVNLPQNTHGCRLVLNAWPFVGVKRVSVSVGGRKLADWCISAKPMEAADYEFHVPGDLTGRTIRLEFDQEKLVSPNQLDKACRDTRTLGLGFISLRMVEK